MYSFETYCEATEKLMTSWYEHSAAVIEGSGELGAVREHFIRSVLANFLPKTVMIGRGEIIDGKEGGRSGQQDVILYRADFPVISSHASINTFLIEGVIATIEVKSDLSKVGLTDAFASAAKVKHLEREAIKLAAGSETEFKKLQYIHSARTYVVGYRGWRSSDSFERNFKDAREAAGGVAPDVIYYPGDPGLCAISNPVIDKSAYVRETPFAFFFQQLLRIVMRTLNPTVSTPGIDAEMRYSFNRYFSLDMTRAQEIDSDV